MRVLAEQGLTWTCLNKFFVCRGVPGSCAGTSGEGMYLQRACTMARPLRQQNMRLQGLGHPHMIICMGLTWCRICPQS